MVLEPVSTMAWMVEGSNTIVVEFGDGCPKNQRDEVVQLNVPVLACIGGPETGTTDFSVNLERGDVRGVHGEADHVDALDEALADGFSD